MMTDFMGAPRRQSKAHVEPTRKALELIRPFVPLFDDWHRRAAKAGATALAHAPLGQRAGTAGSPVGGALR